jgi:hypothetical protein
MAMIEYAAERGVPWGLGSRGCRGRLPNLCLVMRDLCKPESEERTERRSRRPQHLAQEAPELVPPANNEAGNNDRKLRLLRGLAMAQLCYMPTPYLSA